MMQVWHCLYCLCAHFGYTRYPSHLLNPVHALWTDLHPNTLKPNIGVGFSTSATRADLFIQRPPPLLSSPLLSSPLSSPPLLSALLVALGVGPGFQSSDGTRVPPINVTWSDEISFLMQPPPPPPLPNQWEATTSNRVQLSHRAS